MRVLQSFVVVFSALATATLALPTSDTHVVHEYAADSSKEWEKVGNVVTSAKLPVRIGLTQMNLDAGHDLLMEVADPKSAKYGKHYTPQQVVDLFAPHPDSVQAIHSWLASEGISLDRVSRSDNKQWIQFDATVSELEKLLHTKYDIYAHRQTGTRKIGTDEYSVPKVIQHHIDYITPAATKLQLRGYGHPTSFRRPARPAPLAMSEDIKVSNDCSKFITPHCVRELYDVPLGKESDLVDGNDMGIYELESVSKSDLSTFFKKFAPFIPQDTSPIVNRIDGARVFGKPSFNQGEAMLDLDVAYPVIYPQNVRLYSVDDPYYDYRHFTNGLFNTFLDALDGSYCTRKAFNETGDNPKYDPVYPDPHKGGYNHTEMCGTFTSTKVISISYSPDEFQRTVSYDRRQCSEWMKLAMQGVTVVAASGDTGVAGNGGVCLKGGKVFAPLTLTNCPYVVAVGSTYLPKGSDPKTDPEIATTSFPSSGGFSNIYPVPKWQKDAVDAYFEANPSPYKFYETKYVSGKGIDPNTEGVFNRAGRGIPDVAASGDNIVVQVANSTSLSGGTSASAPIFGAIINRINGERMKAGKSSVGFILPVLYSNPQVMNDITVGSNPGCKTQGFNASKGWDPVTGLGTPNYPKMLDLFMGYQ